MIGVKSRNYMKHDEPICIKWEHTERNKNTNGRHCQLVTVRMQQKNTKNKSKELKEKRRNKNGLKSTATKILITNNIRK